jgi:hypothetical protein
MADHHSPPPRSPGVWLGLSIAATILCCWPLSIPGIVFAVQAMQAQERGDVERWQDRVERSGVWTLWSIGVSVVLGVVVFACGFSGALNDSEAAVR